MPALVQRATTPSENDLDDRDYRVLELLVEARATSDIAGRLCLSEHTVRNHIRSLMAKLGAHSGPRPSPRRCAGSWSSPPSRSWCPPADAAADPTWSDWTRGSDAAGAPGETPVHLRARRLPADHRCMTRRFVPCAVFLPILGAVLLHGPTAVVDTAGSTPGGGPAGAEDPGPVDRSLPAGVEAFVAGDMVVHWVDDRSALDPTELRPAPGVAVALTVDADQGHGAETHGPGTHEAAHLEDGTEEHHAAASGGYALFSSTARWLPGGYTIRLTGTTPASSSTETSSLRPPGPPAPRPACPSGSLPASEDRSIPVAVRSPR